MHSYNARCLSLILCSRLIIAECLWSGLNVIYNCESSAYIMQSRPWDLITSSNGAKYRINSNGPSTEPKFLFHVGHVVQNKRNALSLVWREWFSCKCREWKIYCCELPLSSENFHVVVWQTTSKHCTKKRGARAARLFLFNQPIK